MDYVWVFLLLLGAFKLSKSLVCFLQWVYSAFFRPPKDLKKTYGDWALITGATDGIGKAFARRLAQQGLDLILVSRNLEKLEAVSEEILEESPGIKIKVVELDFSSSKISLEKFIHGLDIGVLINNVGITYPGAFYFHELPEKIWKDIINVNVKGTTEVIKAVLPGMVRRRRGAIVNIGSAAAIAIPSHPLYTIYAATKAYIAQLSRCLQVEYMHYGINMQCQVPFYVATKMSSTVAQKQKPSLFVPSADDYAKAAIGRIGYEGICTPYWLHSLQWCLVSLLPEAIINDWRLYVGLCRRREEEYQHKLKLLA